MDAATTAEGSQLANYPGFEGRVGRVFATSEPAWRQRRTAPTGAPNVVVMVADDLGFSDLGCYGSEIPTPNIDALAGAGLRYTNFHVAPLCSPTRASLMTGRNAHAVGMGQVAHIDAGFPGYTGELPEHQPSMAEMFRANGYSTFAIGKWHLCKNADLSEAGDKHSWPLQRGFDQYYGFLEALTNFHHPHRMYEGNSVVDTDQYPDGYYLTDDLTDRAVRMIREVKAADPAKPFFLYYAHGAVHAPLHAKRADIEAIRGMYDAGWDTIRERRLARQIELGIVPAGTELPPRNTEPGEDVVAWDSLTADEQTVFARYMECYAAMVRTIDDSVGAIRAELERHGQLDNTIFIFTSDNGASREGGAAAASPTSATPAAPRGSPPSTDDALARLDEIGGPTTWPHYPRGWAMACNTPFRLYKISTFRGGHSVPLVVSWPARIAADQIVRTQYTHVTDVLPTLAQLTGVEPLTSRNGQPADPLDGVTFVPTLDDADRPDRPQRAVLRVRRPPRLPPRRLARRHVPRRQRPVQPGPLAPVRHQRRRQRARRPRRPAPRTRRRARRRLGTGGLAEPGVPPRRRHRTGQAVGPPLRRLRRRAAADPARHTDPGALPLQPPHRTTHVQHRRRLGPPARRPRHPRRPRRPRRRLRAVGRRRPARLRGQRPRHPPTRRSSCRCPTAARASRSTSRSPAHASGTSPSTSTVRP